MRYDHSYQSAQSHDWDTAAQGGESIPSSQNANFQVGMWYGDAWEVTFSIWNVWDERAINWIDYGNDSMLQSASIQETRFQSLRNYTRPREYSLSVSYNF